MSSTNSKHVMRCAEDFFIAPLLHPHNVNAMSLDLFIEVE